MKLAVGIVDKGIVAGNAFDKYYSRNPLVRQLITRYGASLGNLVRRAAPARIHDVGCGEGYWTIRWMEEGIEAFGSDVSDMVIALARSNASERHLPEDHFAVRDIYTLDPVVDKADLVVCCQVLEHLKHPEEALKSLKLIADPWLIVSVPREPLWRLLNIARGSYLGRGGNTPGHVQHWSKKRFSEFIARNFEVVEVHTPLPWIMILGRNTEKQVK